MSIQNSSKVTQAIICTMLNKSRDAIFNTEKEAQNIARMYEIIYNKVESLNKKS